MANDRVIHISTDFDASSVLKGLSKIQQEMNSLDVDPKLFKDIQKDLDKISKEALSIGTALKDGVSSKDFTPLMNSISNVSKLYSALPEKIRQISIDTKNIRFSPELSKRLEEIEIEMEKISQETKTVLGSDLQKALRDAIPKDFMDTKTIESIGKATDKVGALEDAIANL